MQSFRSKVFWMRNTRQALSGLVAALALLACFPAAALPRVIDGIAIIVNEDAILISEINEAIMPVIEEYRTRYADAELKEKMTELQEMIIKQAIETKLILQVARRVKITAVDATVDARIDVVKSRFPSEEEFLQALEAKGTTYREYREQVAEQVLVQETIKRMLGPDIEVLDNDIQEYYENHQDEFIIEPKVRLAQIFLKVPSESTPEEVERVRHRAEQLCILIEDGVDFSELAQKYSEGPYREKGGVIDVVGPKEILPELEKAAFALKTGEVSPVIQTPYGFHILKALEARPAREIGSEEARPFIEERLREMKQSEKYEDWIKELRKDAFIDIKI